MSGSSDIDIPAFNETSGQEPANAVFMNSNMFIRLE